jgi:hypothetical protein
MLLPEFQSTATDLGKVLGLAHATCVVAGPKGLITASLNVTDQTTYRALGNLKLLGDLQNTLSG